MSKHEISVLGPETAGYPLGLLALQDPPAPARLWHMGGPLPPDAPWVAIVGSRAADSVALTAARQLAATLVDRGCVVISGGAMGVDAAAHAGAIAAGGTTVVFCAGGVDMAGPRFNENLYARILAADGSFLSSERPGTPPRPYLFPKRNRLIAAASAAVIVVQARRRSGTLLTANAALALGKPLLVVPGGFGDHSRLGCIELLRKGALAIGTERHLEESLDALAIGVRLPLFAAKLRRKSAVVNRKHSVCGRTSTEKPDHDETDGIDETNETDETAEESVLNALANGQALGIDGLVKETGLASWTVSSALTTLELAGSVAAAGGGLYMVVRAKDPKEPPFPLT